MSEYDHIVVGAGSAGAALAARLSEQTSLNVLLLEAGPDWGADGDMPEVLRTATGLFNWDAYTILPDYYWQGLQSRLRPSRERTRYLRGRGLGGSSTINGCYAIRPPLEEFDDWAAAGATGWGAADVLPCFVRLEDDRDFAADYHGHGGPIPVERLEESRMGTMDLAFRDAAVALGHPAVPDHSAPHTPVGISPFGRNAVRNRRVSTGDGYVTAARDRENLTVIGDAHVDRVLLTGTRATGVRVSIRGEWHDVTAENVVLSAGAPFSPAILMRSGIGPAQVLRDAGIAPVVDLPVGESLQDHTGVIVTVDSVRAMTASAAGQRGNMMLRWSAGLAGAGVGDIMSSAINVADTAGAKPPSVICILNQVFSRGRVWIDSADPFANPRMEHNLLSDERDRVRLRAGFRHVAELLGQSSFAHLAGFRDTSGAPLDLRMSDAEWDAWVDTRVQDTAHVVATCPIGAEGDPRAVLDPECRVRGVEGLRVVDASSMPTVCRANTNLTVIMMAERVADLIAAG